MRGDKERGVSFYGTGCQVGENEETYAIRDQEDQSGSLVNVDR